MNTKKVILCIIVGIVVGTSFGIIGKLLEMNLSTILFIVIAAGAAVGGVIGVNEVRSKIKKYS